MTAGARARARDWKGLLRSLDAELAKDPSGAFAKDLPPGVSHAAVGLALRRAGAVAEAMFAFEAAVRLDQELWPAWAWLAECELREGNFVNAERHLREAERGFPDWADLHAWRGQLLLALRRPAEAAASLARAAALGRDESALRRKAAAAAAERRRLFAGTWRELAKQGAALAERDADAARELFDAAVAAGLEADAFAARAGFSQRHGAPGEAVGDLTEALARRPTAALHLRRAQALVSHRDYAAALPDFDAALALEPGLGEAYAGRARCRLLTNRPKEAARDLERAVTLCAPDAGLEARRWWAVAAAGKPTQAAAALSRLADPRAAFARGLALLLAGDKKKGAEVLRGCRHPFAPLFALVADLPAESKKGAPGVAIIGAGIDAPLTLTLEGLAAVRACDVVFKNVTAEGIDELLTVVARDWRPLSFRSEYDVPRVCSELLALARRGKRVGFLTFANPAVSGPLAHELLRRCREEKVAADMVPGVSSIDAMVAAVARALGPGFGAHQIVMPATPAAPLDPRLPALLFFDARPPDGWEAFLRGLTRAYPAGQQALLFDAHNDRWQDEPRPIPLERLADISPQMRAQSMAVILPR